LLTKPKVPGLDLVSVKTAILYFIQKEKLENPNFVDENLNDILRFLFSLPL
jgi:N6-L-threonylcarbamoyladenine synthase